MIQQITEIPNTMVAFRAVDEVTEADFKNTVLPAVRELVKRTGKLNYLLVVDTPLKNFTIGAWWQDALLGLKELTHWNRVAILTDSDGINSFTDAFGIMIPGEFRGYKQDQLSEAIDWVAG
ncbi:SpoIIAA family protein [Ohtaekwangia koreensis]|jgi:hypothetical protein|uniref:SpoIIAA-like n=1 Tax=Ohtaekwangia koreensis TaxID=688867 RepID=A0A1T5K3S5_9BACT|nr:STAS/SEC14 domain-containing protein [Ohtaekwangia koreensis]SKC58175.1 SpoIIAA-like [Ohtaekwangia koreensis]